MNHKEQVKGKITGKGNELDRRKKLWRTIADAYERGREDAIKLALINESTSITNEFGKLLKQLEGRL